jgi:2-hydroxy-3-oxopropionate reductase
VALRNNQVTVVGLGAIGLPVAINLAKSGAPTFVWNRTQAPTDKAVAAGATQFKNLSDNDSAIVLTVLPDLPQVDEVLANGLEESMKSGDVLVVMGTVSPIKVAELAKRLSTKGIRLLDAPVSGGDVGAQNATLSIMVGGDAKDLADVLPTFEKIGQTIRHLGAVGAGEMAKACNQIIVAATLTAIAEAVTLGRRAGLDTTVLIDILAGGLAGSQALNVKRSKIESNDYTPGGAANFQLKDLRFALEAGAATGTSLTMTEEVTKLYTALVESGNGGLDHSGIIREIERRSK